MNARALVLAILIVAGCKEEQTVAPVRFGDTVRKPNAPANLVAKVANRRFTSFELTWTAPADGLGNQVAGYVPLIARACTSVCCPGGYASDGGVPTGVGTSTNCVDGGSGQPLGVKYPTDAGDSCGDGGVDGGSCQCQLQATLGCMPLGETFAQAIDAGVTICRGLYTRRPSQPGHQDAWTTSDGFICPPDGGSGYAQ